MYGAGGEGDLGVGDVKVYVVEEGDYEQRIVIGVFDSLEAAKAANPPDVWQASSGSSADGGEWIHDPYDSLRVTEWEVEGA